MSREEGGNSLTGDTSYVECDKSLRFDIFHSRTGKKAQYMESQWWQNVSLLGPEYLGHMRKTS